MTRQIQNWTPEKVEDFPVASHRFRYDTPYVPTPKDYTEWKNSIEYQPGEVVYVQVDTDKYLKAKITHIFNDHWMHERTGERFPKFRVQYETKKGYWSKLFHYVSPGHIQRGYKLAGLAPEMPND